MTVTVAITEEAAQAVLGYALANGVGFDDALSFILLAQTHAPRPREEPRAEPDPCPVLYRRDTGLPSQVREEALRVLADGGWHASRDIVGTIGLERVDGKPPESVLREAMSHFVRDGTVERYPPAVKGRHFHGDIQYRLVRREGSE